MKRKTNTIQRLTGLTLSMLFLALTICANVPLLQCSLSGSIGFKKMDSCGLSQTSAPSHSCCKKQATSSSDRSEKLTISASVCCLYISNDYSEVFKVQNDLSLVALKLPQTVTHWGQKADSEKVLLPHLFGIATLLDQSPPIYLLKQSFLV